MKKTSKKSYNADIFTFFDKANKGEMKYVDQMTDKEVKEINPYVLLMWAQGASQNTAIHTIVTDMYMNDKVFTLKNHPRLLLKLFIAANGEIDDARYRFVKPKTKSTTMDVQSIAEYYQCSIREAEDYSRILSEDDMKEIKLSLENVK